MTKLFTVCVLILLSINALADGVGAQAVDCEKYLRGLANPEILRFGGADPRAFKVLVTPIQEMANLMLDHVPADGNHEVQIALPVFLSVNWKQPEQFGDHQHNALATYGSFQRSPFVGILTRASDPAAPSHGISSPANVPDGNKLAWGFTDQWVGTWLKPGQAFVTRNGLYHWHLNHLPGQIAAQVLTPPFVPGEDNHFGFPKK